MVKLTAGLTAIAAATLIAGTAAPALASESLNWSAPQLIAPPSASQSPNSFTPGAVSCPTESLCLLAGAQEDQIDVVRNPAGAKPSQSVFAPRTGGGVGALACPSTTLCVALDGTGSTGDPATYNYDVGLQILTSTDPTGGPSAWSSGSPGLDSSTLLLSCPSSALCVAAVDDKELLTTTNPAGGFATWVTTSLPTQLAALACPSESLCVGIDTGGHVLTSTNPSGGASTWTGSGAPSLGAIAALSCPETSLCVAADSHGNVLTSTSPTSSAAWQSANVDGTNPIATLACPSTSLCVAADGTGRVMSTASPATGPWKVDDVNGGRAVGSLSCPTASFCLSLSGLRSTGPNAGTAAWSALRFPVWSELTSLACPASSLCVTVAGDQRLWTSTRPARGARFWKSTSPRKRLPKGASFQAVACPSRSLCLAIVQPTGAPLDHPAPLFSFDPRGGAHAFKLVKGPTGQLGFEQLTCLPGPLCAVEDSDGKVFISRDPARARSWKRYRQQRPLFDVACPERRFCVALAQPAPAGFDSIGVSTGGPYLNARIDPGHGLTGIACPSRQLCVAVDDAGNVLTSTNPGGGPGAWTSTRIDTWGLTAVRCPSASFCLATDEDGRLVIGRR